MTYKFSYQILNQEREKKHNQQQNSFKKTKNNQCSNNAPTN